MGYHSHSVGRVRNGEWSCELKVDSFRHVARDGEMVSGAVS